MLLLLFSVVVAVAVAVAKAMLVFLLRLTQQATGRKWVCRSVDFATSKSCSLLTDPIPLLA
jgi:hypothetical protein